MSADRSTVSLAVVRRCRNEPEGAIVVAFLEDAGIEARMQGVLASSFRVEAPGDVAVMVLESDLERAQKVLPPEHEPQIEMDAEAQVPEPPDGANSLRFWLRVAGLILLVCLLASFVGYVLFFAVE